MPWGGEACAVQTQGPEFDPWHSQRKLGLAVHTCNLTTGEAETGSLGLASWPALPMVLVRDPFSKTKKKCVDVIWGTTV